MTADVRAALPGTSGAGMSDRSPAAVGPLLLLLTVGDINTSQRGELVSIDEIIEGSFRDHAAAIRGKALQLTRDPEVAADVTQEAFLRLFVEAQAGRMPDNVPAWLYRTTANLIVSRARHSAVANRFASSLVRDDAPAQPEAIAVLRESRDEVEGLLSALSASDRAVLLLAAHGATGLEIADRMGRSHTASRAALCRARGRLRSVAGVRGVPAFA